MNFDILLIKIYTHDNMKHVINVLKFLLFSNFYLVQFNNKIISVMKETPFVVSVRFLEFSNIKKNTSLYFSE